MKTARMLCALSLTAAVFVVLPAISRAAEELPCAPTDPASSVTQPTPTTAQPGSASAADKLQADNGAPDDAIWVKGRMSDLKNGRIEVSLGDFVILKTKETLKCLLDMDKDKIGNRLGLFINDMYFKDIPPLPVAGRPKAAMFHLKRTDMNRDNWGVLYARKGFGSSGDSSCDRDPQDGIIFNVGYEDGTSAVPEPISACLEYFPKLLTGYGFLSGIGPLLLAALLLVGTVWMAIKSSMLRDIGIAPPGRMAPFSLARCQMALWFVTIVISVLYCYSVTGDISPIPQGALILMGIGAGTAVGAAAMDVNALPGTLADYRLSKKQQSLLDLKVKDLESRMAATDPDRRPLLQPQLDAAARTAEANRLTLKKYESAPTGGFFTDILSDGSGIAFHRLQVFAWTMVYWLFFLGAVIRKLTLMDFDTTQLALMGISGATYLGFKLQQQSKSVSTTTPANAAPDSADGGDAAASGKVRDTAAAG